MGRRIKLWDPKKEEWYYSIYKTPKGYERASFTDIGNKKDLEKKGYETKIAPNPYGKRGKVVFYKKIRRKKRMIRARPTSRTFAQSYNQQIANIFR